MMRLPSRRHVRATSTCSVIFLMIMPHQIHYRYYTESSCVKMAPVLWAPAALHNLLLPFTMPNIQLFVYKCTTMACSVILHTLKQFQQILIVFNSHLIVVDV